MNQNETEESHGFVWKPKVSKAALQVFACIFLCQIVCAIAVTPQFQLSSIAISELQQYSGQRVILTGYFVHRFERSVLYPGKHEANDPDSIGSLWVDLVDGAESKFLGLPFSGWLRIEGTLETGMEGQYGHLGLWEMRLTNASVVGVLPRQWATALLPLTTIFLIMVYIVSRWRRNAHDQGRIRGQVSGPV